MAINDYLSAVNENWNKAYADLPPRSDQKVQFADKPIVRHMITWSFAYQAARKGPWDQYARDSDRFKRRIAQIEKQICHIFLEDHVTSLTNQNSQMSHDTS